MLFPDAKPNPAHLALAKLEEMGKLKAVITQNIDGLHQAAGSKTVLELHGSVRRNHCTRCMKFFSLEEMLSSMGEDGIPRCTCSGVIKPDVVLYEESLDEGVLSKSVAYISQADLLIIGGTSLTVYPAAGLIDYYRGSKMVLINKTVIPMDEKANLVISGSIGEVLYDAVGV
jgi:NAD-dependent deacetylase